MMAQNNLICKLLCTGGIFNATGQCIIIDKHSQFFRMRKQISSVKHQIWTKLAVFFNKYKGLNGQMSYDRVQAFIVDVLGEETKEERAYVMNNFFRVDLDLNGTVSFFELGSFLFSEHCSEISLQRHHKLGKMKYGDQRKMTLPEFIYLINQAYKFLSVCISESEGKKLFDSVDDDRDNLITYEEYFKILHINACTKELPPEIKVFNSPAEIKIFNPPAEIKVFNPPAERHSKLRKYMWERLRMLFDAHVKGRSLPVNEMELRALITVIVGDFSSADIDFLLFYLGMSESSNIIKFEPLASRFIEVAARLGLKNFMKNHLESKKSLNKYEFARLLKTSFRFLDLGRFKNNILYRIFQKIDRDHDGWISYEEYMDWVIKFLAVGSYKGTQFLANEDNLDSDTSLALEAEINYNPRRLNMVFSDYSLARAVRMRVREIILTYAKDQHRLFTRLEIEKVMRGVTKGSMKELHYIIAGVYREDEGEKGAVTLNEFINFLIQLHYGENAIQRLHFTDHYMEGRNRKMNKSQFKKTLELMLSYINMKAQSKLIDTLFNEIDAQKTNFISYKQYFTFNLFYFGKSSIAALNIHDVTSKTPRLSEDQYFVFKFRHFTPYPRFKAMMIQQVMQKLKNYGCTNLESFETDRMRMMMENTFKMPDVEVEHVHRKIFNYMVERGKMANLEEIIELILASYFELHLAHRQAKTHFNPEKEHLMDYQQFFQLMIDLCHFAPIKPLIEDLEYIFNDTDCNKDRHISWHEYADFVKNIFAIRTIYNEQLSETKSTVNSYSNKNENMLIEDIETTLKKMWEKHENNDRETLNRHEVGLICKDLKIFCNRELKYITWSLFQADLNSHRPQKQIDFPHYSSFILNYVCELSLEKFQMFQSEPSKNELLYAEFYLIIHNAFSPLVEMAKYRETVSKISRRIGKSDELTYSKYMNWVHESFAMSPQKKMIE